VTGEDQEDTQVFDQIADAANYVHDLVASYNEAGWATVDLFDRYSGAKIVLSPPGYGNEHVICLEEARFDIEQSYHDHFVSVNGEDLERILQEFDEFDLNGVPSVMS